MAAIDPKAKLVQATGTVVSASTNLPEALAIAGRLQDAMIKATEDAMAEGISDPDVIKQRKFDALAAARAEMAGVVPSAPPVADVAEPAASEAEPEAEPAAE